MGKGDSRGKAARKQKHRNAQAWDMELAKTPRPKARGRARMEEIKAEGGPKDAADRLVLETRCRKFGLEPTADNLTAARAVVFGEHLGMVINKICGKEEAQDLWNTWQDLLTADMTYRRLKLGMSLHAKNASIAMVRERLEAGEHITMTYDDRDFEDRLRGATTRWMIWQGRIDRLETAYRTLIHDVIQGRGELLWNEATARPTQKGIRTLFAMQRLHATGEQK